MNGKKIAIIGVIALIVIGCVVAAGCTSSTSTSTTTTTVNDKIIGVWTGVDNYNGSNTVTIINNDGTGLYTASFHDGTIECYTLKWTANKDGTYSAEYINGDKRTYTIDSSGNVLTSNSGNVKYKKSDNTVQKGFWLKRETQDKIIGLWSGVDNFDKSITSTLIREDGTGHFMAVPPEGDTVIESLTWTPNNDGTYALKFSSGDDRTYSLDSTGSILTSSSGNIKYRNTQDPTLVGIWYNKDDKTVVVFNANGTGFWKDAGKEKANFKWEGDINGGFKTTYIDGDNKGKTFEWTIDYVNNVLTSSSGHKFTYPKETIKDVVSFL